jgi:AcrR family transcriptional regulator
MQADDGVPAALVRGSQVFDEAGGLNPLVVRDGWVCAQHLRQCRGGGGVVVFVRSGKRHDETAGYLAGYTPGAIYSYFASKEEVYAALLGESLNRLNGRVETARAECTGSGAVLLMATAKAFFEFYRENPRDLDLGFYLFQGMQPRGLTPALNETLNARLRDALRPTQDALETMGMPPGDASAEITALFAHIVGLLMLSHTGRIRMFKQASQELFDRYLDRLVAMAAAPDKASRSKRGRNRR